MDSTQDSGLSTQDPYSLVRNHPSHRLRIRGRDFDFKKNHVVRFLQHGDKVKAIVRFRGREMTHMELGKAVLDRLLVEVKEFGASESPHPDLQGNRMSVVIAPVK